MRIGSDQQYTHHSGVRLALRPMVASQLNNSQRILFSSDGVEQGYYQFANWAEPPPKRITAILLDAFEASKIFDSVSFAWNSATADYVLVSELVECLHDTSTEPGKAKVRIRAELVRLSTRELIAQRSFSAEVPVASYDARGSVEAITSAVHTIGFQMLDWTSDLTL